LRTRELLPSLAVMDPRLVAARRGAGTKTSPEEVKALVQGDSALYEALGLTEDQLQNLRESALRLLSAGHLSKAVHVARALLSMQDIHPAGSFVMSQVLLLQGNQPRARLYIDVAVELAQALELPDLEALAVRARDRMGDASPS
jgi:hypothetical protein